jgi:hypothetical protein
VPACAELKFGLDVVFEVPDQELSHGAMIARYRRTNANLEGMAGAVQRGSR